MSVNQSLLRVNYRKLYKLFYVFIYLFILNDLISEIKMTMSIYLWHLRPTQRYKAKKNPIKIHPVPLTVGM